MNDHHGVADKEHRTEDMTADELVAYVEDTLNLIYEGI